MGIGNLNNCQRCSDVAFEIEDSISLNIAMTRLIARVALWDEVRNFPYQKVQNYDLM